LEWFWFLLWSLSWDGREPGADQIGLIDVYSGAGAAFGKQCLNGWQMAVDEFNAKGGLKGRKIEILTRTTIQTG